MSISDEESIRGWLHRKQISAQTAFICRAALRALPEVTADYGRYDPLLLAAMRATLVSLASLFRSNPKIANMAERSGYAATIRANEASSGDSRNALELAGALATKISTGDLEKNNLIASAIAKTPWQASDVLRKQIFLSATDGDVRHIESEPPETAFSLPLWHEEGRALNPPFELARLQSFWKANPKTWGFWSRWYEGQPLPWALQEQVALIPDADWEKGPEHVAGLIEEIEARFELELRIAELERELARASASRFGVGGNYPPEPIQDAPLIDKGFTVIWEPIQALKEEAASPTPDPSRIKRATAALVALIKQCGAYLAKTTDTAVGAAAKATGAAGGVAIAAWVAGHGDKVQMVIDAAERFSLILLK